MTWKERFQDGMAGGDSRPGFRDGMDDKARAVLEKRLGVALPTPLRELLQETDGVHHLLKVSDDEEVEIGWIVWPSKEVAAESPALAKAAARARKGALVFFAPGDDVSFALDEAGQSAEEDKPASGRTRE